MLLLHRNEFWSSVLADAHVIVLFAEHHMPWRPYFHGASHKQTGKEENREEARCSGRGCSVHNNTRQYTHMCTHARTSKQASKQAMCSLPFTEVGGAHADDRRLQCSEQNYQFPSHAPMAL
eukprot:scaffold6695_cov14-Tisochrysis_lutea.AAC.1